VRYVLVLLASLAVGALVYVVSLRTAEGRPSTAGFEPAPPGEGPSPGEAPPPGYTYLQVEVTHGPSAWERIQGLLGSLALVAIAAVGLALSTYAIGTLVGRIVRSYIGR
jgi:hypothetical protein